MTTGLEVNKIKEFIYEGTGRTDKKTCVPLEL